MKQVDVCFEQFVPLTIRGRAPHVGENPWAYLLRRLGPGSPPAPRGSCLPLLPSGPGGVHRSPSRGTQPSMTPFGDIGLTVKPRGGIRPRYSGLRVQGTASSPPSTASRTMVGRGALGCQSNRGDATVQVSVRNGWSSEPSRGEMPRSGPPVRGG